MPKFKVSITESKKSHWDFEIEADTEEDALEIGWGMAGVEEPDDVEVKDFDADVNEVTK